MSSSSIDLTPIIILLLFIANYLGHIAESLGEIAKNSENRDDKEKKSE